MRIGGESPRYELVPVDASPPKLATGCVKAASGAAEGAFLKALKGVGHAVDGGEALIRSASHGNLGGLDSVQLIALQAGIYRYSEAVDLVAKLVDRAANAVRTVVSPHS
jgi:tetrahydromethanopterin S-methyltransferase subunit C